MEQEQKPSFAHAASQHRPVYAVQIDQRDQTDLELHLFPVHWLLLIHFSKQLVNNTFNKTNK